MINSKRSKVFFFSLIVFLFFGAHFLHSEDGNSKLTIYFFDVGYGDAALIYHESKTHAVLIDAGNFSNGSLIVDHLKKIGIQKVSAFISHAHSNHYGGFFELAERVPIETVYTNGIQAVDTEYQRLIGLFLQKAVPVSKIKRGDQIEIFPGTQILVLHPDNISDEVHNDSLVLQLLYGKSSFLFFTDASPAIQDELIERYGESLKSYVIQVPHHGGPLSQRFSEFFKGRIFIMSTGSNENAIPDPDEILGLQGKIYRTDQNGSIEIQTDGQNIKVINHVPIINPKREKQNEST